jgi:hypothetical protein
MVARIAWLTVHSMIAVGMLSRLPESVIPIGLHPNGSWLSKTNPVLEIGHLHQIVVLG